MKILEILLPKGTTDRSLPPGDIRKIGLLQDRMGKYVDKILDPSTSAKGREFLKSQLRNDYHQLRDIIPKTHVVAEDSVDQYEVYDRRTGEKVSGPYSNKLRASRAADKKDMEYGAIRYGYRAVKKRISEAVTKLPLTPRDFDLVKKMFERPIPAAIAPIFISEIIEDDELNAELDILEETDPGRDVRPLIAEWFRRVMPDQMHQLTDEEVPQRQKEGVMSVIHGYDSHFYKGTNDPVTGNAYGSY